MKILAILLFSLNILAASEQYVILIPGAASSGDQISIRGLTPVFGPIKEGKYFKHLELKLKNKFQNVLTCPKLRDKDSRNLTKRAYDCSAFILANSLKNPYAKYHLVGHSMGGLVARKILDLFPVSRLIKSVTTIATPHKGSILANYVIENHQKKSVVGSFIRLIEFSPAKRKYIPDLAIKNNRNLFSESLRNRLNIPIYSISNYKTNLYNTPLAVTSKIISLEAKKYENRSKKSDGIIETSSMVYGTHLAEIKADHLEAGCVLYTRYAKGCKRLLKVLIPHLQKVHNSANR